MDLSGACAQTSAAQTMTSQSHHELLTIPSTLFNIYHYSMESADLDTSWTYTLPSQAWFRTRYEIEDDDEKDGQANYRLSRSFSNLEQDEIISSPFPAWYEDTSLLPIETGTIIGQISVEPWSLLQSSGGIQEVEAFSSRLEKFSSPGSWNSSLPSTFNSRSHGDKHEETILVGVCDF